MSDKDPVHPFPGEAITVNWDGRLCIHVAECGRADNALFEGGRKPWCQPDLVTLDEAVEVVHRCPTGALSYQRADGQTEPVPSENRVAIANNGPLYVTGDLDVDGAAPDMAGVKSRVALCRCGLSKNKPFCDNSHEGAFVDRGAVGSTGSPLAETGGPLSIQRAKNGPLLLSGNITIVNPAGRVAWQGTKAALCRCGQSKNKPFCDGAHKAAGFEAD